MTKRLLINTPADGWRWLMAVACCIVLLQGCVQRTDARAMNDDLIAAAEQGDTVTALQLLADGAEIDARDARGRTAVMAATHGNRAETVQALIRAGADINIRDNRMDNVLLYAGAEGLLDILTLAIDAGADTRLTNRFGGTALIPAAERGHVAVVETLLTRSDVEVNHINNLGWTALLEAIILSNGDAPHQRIVQLLVDHGADMNLADSGGVTPLRHAQSRGFTEIVRILEAAGAQSSFTPTRVARILHTFLVPYGEFASPYHSERTCPWIVRRPPDWRRLII